MKIKGKHDLRQEEHELPKGSNGQRTPRDDAAREEGSRKEEGPIAVHTQRTKRQRE